MENGDKEVIGECYLVCLHEDIPEPLVIPDAQGMTEEEMQLHMRLWKDDNGIFDNNPKEEEGIKPEK